MSKETIFKGIATALVTPFTENGIDYESFGKLVDWQISEGIDALVVCGTSGEASTLTDDEHIGAIRFVAERAAGRVPVIAGTGSNDTAYAVWLTKKACDAGADAMLVVTPYYNKATQKGLINMFTDIADASTKPVILYNVPSRTGVAIEPSTYGVLADHDNIYAIKEANGNISKIAETMAIVGDRLDLYAGNDDQIVPIMALGGIGAISVLSNVIPKQTCEICKRFFAGDIKGSASLQLKYIDLINALFSEVNPIPAKAAAEIMGFCNGIVRSPLTRLEDANRERLIRCMREVGLDV